MSDGALFLVAICNWFVSKNVRFDWGIFRLGLTSHRLKKAQCPMPSHADLNSCAPLFQIAS